MKTRLFPIRVRVCCLAAIAITLIAFALPVSARITKVVITTTQSPTFGGYSWPGVGQYEKLVGMAYGEVDPNDPKNSVITDIGLAPLNANGHVAYSFTFYILKPINLSKGAHKVMYEPPNRGGKTWASLGRITLDPGGLTNDPGSSITNPTVLANTFLMPRGYTMVWSGWDFAAGTNTANFNSIINLPIATNGGTTITGPAFEYIVTSGTSYTLNYAAATLDQTKATLTHRVHLDDTPVVVPTANWSYNATGTAITLPAPGFVANDIYEFSYTAKNPTVNGLGFAAIRDWNAWLRYETHDDFGTANPLAGDITRIYTETSSQPARTLNDFTHLGFNQAENGKIVFDAMMQWIGAGDGINMNYRWSQTGRTERNRQDHLFAEGVFPFANVTTTDPFTGKTESRYTRCKATHTCPLAAEIYSANEYWVKAASLLHTAPDGTRDLGDSRYTRLYFISSHQHGTGNSASKGVCQQLGNPLNSAPIQRALFVDLDEWLDGTPPPPTQVPRLYNGTLVPPLPQSGMGFPSIPGVTYTGLKTTRYRFDYGAGYYDTGIPTINPPVITPPYEDNPANGPIYPSFIPKTDSDGNDIAGVRLVDVAVPLATYTGWSLRSGVWANDGCESAGQFIPFPKTAADRTSSLDPRLSVAERYPTYGQYYIKVSHAINRLVRRRLMLPEDVNSELTRLVALGQTWGVPANRPPVAVCENATVRTTAFACSAPASVNHHSSDPDNDKITLAQAPPGPYGLGATPVTLTVSDPYGGSNSCSATVTVIDKTPPHISSLTASPNILWPPNNKLVPVTLSVTASDACDGNVAGRCQIVSVTSNERQQRGSPPDYQITGNLTLNLRAEQGNVYTVDVMCTDTAGNGATKTVKVAVSHDH